MSTNISKRGDTPKRNLKSVCLKLEKEENDAINAFFSIWGMKKDFLDEYPDTKRDAIYNALRTGTYPIQLLKDMRQFKADHEAEVNELLEKK